MNSETTTIGAGSPSPSTPLLGRTDQILAGLRGQNEIATFEGMGGYWVQADCVFIHAPSPQRAIEIYRRKMSYAQIACSHNHHCDGIRAAKASRPNNRIS